jgi:hypothetical protein
MPPKSRGLTKSRVVLERSMYPFQRVDWAASRSSTARRLKFGDFLFHDCESLRQLCAAHSKKSFTCIVLNGGADESPKLRAKRAIALPGN